MNNIYKFSLVVTLYSVCILANTKNHFQKFVDNKMFFSAYTTMFELKEGILNRTEIENVLARIDSGVLLSDTRLESKRFYKGYEYALAIISMKQFKYNEAAQLLAAVEDSKLLPYVNFLLGEIKYKTGNLDEANKYFLKCSIIALDQKDKNLNEARFYNTIFGYCMQNISRVFFEKKQYSTALKYYKQIKQDNYVWPLTLIDLAWTYYWNKDYSRALGTLLSFKLDILTKFFEPEVTYLRALIYYELCYFNRAEAIVDNFNTKIWSSFPELVLLLRSSSRMSFEELENRLDKPSYAYVSKYLDQVKNSYKFKKYDYYKEEINREIGLLEQHKNKRYYSDVYLSLLNYSKAIVLTRDNFIKMEIYEYAKKIKMAQRKITKLKLNLNLKKRKLVRSSDEEEFDKSIITKSLKTIKNSQNKYIWEFKGGFWIDEMGDYAIAVENKCI